MALPIFAITLFVSAFLLFLVQPMIGKLILPKLGGTPQVWNTCMVFFQSVLLLGYAYTHSLSTRLKLRQQLMVHCALLVVPIGLIIWQPFYSTVYEWEPPTGGNPIPQTLMLLATLVGIPFFVVSTTAPLLQKWFAYSGDPAAKDPYFLYGASNLGSLLSLLFYPVLIEPFAALPFQTDIWLYGYIALALMVGYCAFLVSTMAPPDEQIEAESAQTAAAAEAAAPAAESLASAAGETPSAETPPAPAPAPSAPQQTAVKPGHGPGGRAQRHKKGAKAAAGAPGTPEPEEEKSVAIETPDAQREHSGATAEMTNWRRLRWVLLAAVPSSLMLGVTTYISTDLSPFPLVWVGALALYLLSFILVYMKFWTGTEVALLGGFGFLANRDRQHAGVTWHDATICALQPLGIVVLCFLIVSGGFGFGYAFMAWVGFFACALACHGELAKDRPATKHLTEYFLMMSVGGMVGGLFNGIFAPVLFQRGVIEFHIAVVIACLVRPQYIASGWFDELVMSAFPGLQAWFRNQGDEMAKSMGREPPRSTYLFSTLMDIIFGVFILAISYYLAKTFWLGQSRYSEAMESAIKLLGLTQGWQVRILYQFLVFFIPLIFCFFFAGRPLRLGLAVTGLMIGNVYLTQYSEDATLEARRTYFGLLRVKMDREGISDPDEVQLFRDNYNEFPEELKKRGMNAPPYHFTFLMHGTTYHGRNYLASYDEDKMQKFRVDLSRLATTYYHRYGPVGYAMEQYNWFSSGALLRHPTEREDPKNPKSPYRLQAPTKLPDKWADISPGRQNDFSADARLPASIVASAFGAAMNGGGAVLEPVLAPWSEPPIATIGLGTGTMASYARPFGFMTYYEIDDVIRHFSLPESGEQARFTYLQQAIRRGVNLEVIMGDARQSLEPKRESLNKANSFVYQGNFKLGEELRAYSKINYNSRLDQQMSSKAPDRDKFYKIINVDAFSSDAIPIHLVTKRAIEIYLSKLTDDGVLCVHTSNRHMDLVRPVARIAMELDRIAQAKGEPRINVRVGKDSDKGRYMGHFSSEYVMIYRGDHFHKYLDTLAAKKKEFIKNRTDAVKGAKSQQERDAAIARAESEGKLMLYPVHDEKGNVAYQGRAKAGWQILNADVYWYNPFEEHKVIENNQYVDRPITAQDSLWTDDYSYIIGVLR